MPRIQIPRPTTWLVINIRHFPLSRLCCLALTKNKMKVLTATALRSHFSQLLLFSEYPMMSSNFLNRCAIHQVLVERVDNQKTFPGILISSRVFRSIPNSRLGFLEFEGMGA